MLLLLLLGAAPPTNTLPDGMLARLGADAALALPGLSGVALSPDGARIAVAYGHGVAILDASTGKRLRMVERGWPDYRGHDRIAYSADGSRLLADDGSLYDAREGRLLRKGDALRSGAFSVAAEADLSARSEGGPARLIRSSDGRGTRLVELPRDGSALVALSPDGMTLATFSRKSVPPLRLWDTATGKDRPAPAFDGEVRHLALGSGGKRLALATRGQAMAWDGGKRLFIRDLPAEPAALAFAPDAASLAVGLADGRVILHDAAKAETFARRVPATLVGLAFAKDRLIALGRQGSALRAWDVRRGEPLIPGHESEVLALAFSRDGRRLHSAGADGSRSWTAPDWRPGPAFPPVGDRPLAISPEMPLVAWATKDAVRISGTGRGERIAHLETPEPRMATFTADGSILAALYHDGGMLLRTWDTVNWRARAAIAVPPPVFLRKAYEKPAPWIDAAFSPDGLTVALAGKGRGEKDVFLRGAGTADLRLPHGWSDCRLAISPDGRRLVVAGYGTALVRDTFDGAGLLHFKLASRLLVPKALAFSPDGRMLAVGSEEGFAVHESATGRIRVQARSPGVRSLVFSPDGSMLAIGGTDAGIGLWDATGRAWATLGGAGLRAEEWAALGDDAGHAGAMARLLRHPRRAVDLLRAKLAPAPGKPLTPAQFKRFVDGLAADLFADRFRAEKALAEIDPARLLAARGADERVRARLEQLARSADDWTTGLAPSRALEVLERLDTEEARGSLRVLAAGNVDALLTRQAKAALARLEAKR